MSVGSRYILVLKSAFFKYLNVTLWNVKLCKVRNQTDFSKPTGSHPHNRVLWSPDTYKAISSLLFTVCICVCVFVGVCICSYAADPSWDRERHKHTHAHRHPVCVCATRSTSEWASLWASLRTGKCLLIVPGGARLLLSYIPPEQSIWVWTWQDVYMLHKTRWQKNIRYVWLLRVQLMVVFIIIWQLRPLSHAVCLN